MSPQDEPFSIEQMRLGPIEAVEVFTTPPPAGREVSEALDAMQVPFEEIKHLIADKPLVRPKRPETQD